MAQTILVTGSTGNVGSEVVKTLAAARADFYAAVHSPQKAAALQAQGIKTRLMDFSDPVSMVSAMKGIDRLFLLQPLTPAMAETANTAVAAAIAAGVKRIVRLSGMGADPKGAITLARWHGTADDHVMRSGADWAILRPNSFMQNFSVSHGWSIRDKGEFYLPLENAAVSWVDVRDIARAAAAALTADGHSGAVYTLSGPAALTCAQVAAALTNASGRPVRYVAVSADAAREGMKGAGLPDWLVDALGELFAVNRAGYTAAVTPDIERITGRPPAPFEKFARDYAAAFRP